ncbi:hypothetical protein NUU61_007012, partial [Penicillium alfredii]
YRRLDIYNYVSTVVSRQYLYNALRAARILVLTFKLASLINTLTKGFRAIARFTEKFGNTDIRQIRISRIGGYPGYPITKLDGSVDLNLI